MTFPKECRPALWLALIVLLGLGLRLYHLDHYCLWGDETFSWLVSSNPLSFLWTTCMQEETNPAGYYTLLHFWMQLFGQSEFALRFPSMVISTLAIIAIYLLGKQLEGPRTGLIAALILALCPAQLWYGQEARCYALLHCLDALVLLGLARFLAAPTSKSGMILYAITATAAVYTHDTALFLVAACNVAVLLAALGRNALLSGRALVLWVAVNAVVGLLILPQILVMWHQTSATNPNISWIPPLTPGMGLSRICRVLGGESAYYDGIRTYAAPILAAMLAGFALAAPYPRRTFFVLFVTPVAFLVLLAAASHKQSIFFERPLSWLWIPLSVALAAGIVRGRLARWILVPALVILFVPGLKAQLHPAFVHKYDWRGLATEFHRQAPAGTVALADPRYIKIATIAYYAPELLPQTRLFQILDLPTDDFTSQFLTVRFHLQPIRKADLPALIKSGVPVAVFLESIDLHELDGLPPHDHEIALFPSESMAIRVRCWGPGWPKMPAGN